jgi:hypothetical protein
VTVIEAFYEEGKITMLSILGIDGVMLIVGWEVGIEVGLLVSPGKLGDAMVGFALGRDEGFKDG